LSHERATFIVWLESLFVTVPAPELGDAFTRAAEPRFLASSVAQADPARLAGDAPLDR
jgi:hypothetical protein